MSQRTATSEKITNLCFIGAGHVGGPTSAVVALKHPQLEVNVVDTDAAKIEAWTTNAPPISEPGLGEILRKARDGSDGRIANLTFSTDVRESVRKAQIIFITVDTPTKSTGHGAHQALDTSHLESAVQMIAEVSNTNKIIVEKSTVPCGTSRVLRDMLNCLGQRNVQYDVLSNPEFLAEGTAIQNLLKPDRILIGSIQDERGFQAAESLSQIYESWVSRDRIVKMNIESAELAKLAANALLAQRISSINALSAICEETGADIEEVAKACGMDSRIGQRMLKASLGFGGSCLKKDVLTLAHLSDTLGLDEIGRYWRAVHHINENQKTRFIENILHRMNNTLAGKKIAVLGCAFKKNTGDIRESPAIALLGQLLQERGNIFVYDPQVTPDILLKAVAKTTKRSATDLVKELQICQSAQIACRGVQAIVIGTEWDEFDNRPTKSSTVSCSAPKVDWEVVAGQMEYPKLLFDGRNVTDSKKFAELGITVYSIGKVWQ